MQRIWLDHLYEWPNRLMHPLENVPDYGREITNIVSTVSLLLCLDDPKRERETLLLRFVQRGMDYYGSRSRTMICGGLTAVITPAERCRSSSLDFCWTTMA